VDAALERGVDINTCDEHGYSSIHYAARRGNLKVLKYLVSKNGDINKVAENDIGETPLLLSIDSGDLSVTHYLASRGADPSICNKYGFNALHCAVNGRRTLHLAYLLKLPGVNVNAQDYTGRTVRPPEHCYYIVRLPLS
jgi:ankyrin repeat protein